MGLEFLGGIANAYKGYQQGADQEMDRQQKEKERQRQEVLNQQNDQLFTARMEQTGLQTKVLRRAEDKATLQDSVRSKRAKEESDPGFGLTPTEQPAGPDFASVGVAPAEAPVDGASAPAVASAPAAAQPAPIPASATPAPAPAPAAPKLSIPGGIASAAAIAARYRKDLEYQRDYAMAGDDFDGARSANASLKTMDEKAANVAWWGSANAKTDQQLVAELAPIYNANRTLDGDVSFDPKAKQIVVKPYDPAQPVKTLNRNVLLTAAFTAHRIGRGDVAEGLAAFSALDDKQRHLAVESASKQLDLAKAQSEASYKETHGKALLMQAQAARAAGAAKPEAFDPRAGFNYKDATNDATKVVDSSGVAQDSQARAKAITDHVNALEAIHVRANTARYMERKFMEAAQQANTPEEIETLRKTMATRIPEVRMAQLDPRFKTAAPLAPQPPKPGAKTERAAQPAVQPAPGSWAANQREQTQRQAQEKLAITERQTQQAQVEFDSARGNKVSAAKLQASDLFGFLSRAQQQEIYNTVNAR